MNNAINNVYLLDTAAERNELVNKILTNYTESQYYENYLRFSALVKINSNHSGRCGEEKR